MASSSITGGTRVPQNHSGTDIDSLGPSDTSDSGSDVQGEQTMATAPGNRGEWGATPSHHDSDSDSMGTGARAAAAGPDLEGGSDIRPDRVIGPNGERSPITDEDARNLSVLGVDDDADEEDGDDGEDGAAVDR